MRFAALLVVLPLLTACTKSDQAASDTSTIAIGPAALTDADFAGTWTGTARMEGSDSVFLHWTQVCGSGSCAGTSQEMPDTVKATYSIDADSSMGTSAVNTDPATGAKVVDHWVARVSGTSVSGHGWATLADKPDSVVMRYRFEGAKK